MHNFSTTGSQAEPTLSNNMAIIETAYNNEAYHYWVGASEMEDAGDTTSPTYRVGDITTGFPHKWRFADAFVCSVGFFVKRHGEWRDGVVSVVPYYSSTSASGAIRWRVSIVPIANLAAPIVTTVGITKNSPAVTGAITSVDLSDATISLTSQVNTAHIGVYVTIGRSGTHADDTNTGVMDLYGVDLVYKESRRVVGSGG
jgi:hypothetical protein